MQTEEKACENIYDEVSPPPPVVKFDIEENGSVRPVVSRKNLSNKGDGNKIVIIAFIVTLVLVLFLMTGVVGLSIEITKLKSERSFSLVQQEQDFSTVAGRLGSLNSSLELVFWQLSQEVLALDNRTQQQDTSFHHLLNYVIESILLEQFNSSQLLNALVSDNYLQLNQSLIDLEASTNKRFEDFLAEQDEKAQAILELFTNLNSSVSKNLAEKSNALNSSFTQLLNHEIESVQSSLEKVNETNSQSITALEAKSDKKFQTTLAEYEQSVNNISVTIATLNTSFSEKLIQSSTEAKQMNLALNLSFAQQLTHEVENVQTSLFDQLNGHYLHYNQSYSELEENIDRMLDLLAEQEVSQSNIIENTVQSLNFSINSLFQRIESKTHELNESFTEQLISQTQDIWSNILEQLDNINLQLNQTYTELENSVSIKLEKASFFNELNLIHLGEQIATLNSSIHIVLQQSILNRNWSLNLNESYQALNNLVESILEQADETTTFINQTINELHMPGKFPFYPASSCRSLPPSYPSDNCWVMDSNGSVVNAYCNMTGRSSSYPAASCTDLPFTFPSDYYWVKATNDSAMLVYCDMTGLRPLFPASSCAALPPSSPSDYYWVKATNDSAVLVYCDMTGLRPLFPASSCAALPPSSPSNYYWVRASNGSAVRVYCDMTGLRPLFPASSCAALPPSSPSSYYWVRASNGSAVRVYCDMTRSCGGVTGGWMRVAELDMTNTSQQCPSGLRQRTHSNIRTCARNTDSHGCSSIAYPMASILQYSKVCGKVIAYQYGTPDGFTSSRSPNPIHLDGVSLTHGNFMRHIWTFVAAHDESALSSVKCRCMTSSAPSPPSFVGNDYFCDTGVSRDARVNVFYSDDPLWDGAGCGSSNRCCTFNSPPWFYKQLSQPTTDSIEMRVCRDEVASNEDIAVSIVELFVQ